MPAEARADYDDSGWEVVNAPHDMLIVQGYSQENNPKMAYIARNVGWYRKHFRLPSEWKGSAVWVYFEGIFHRTTPYLNGAPLGELHQAGYTSFWRRLDNAPGVKFGDEGENVLALYADASSGTGWWYEGGGLSRHQFLVRADHVHMEQDGAWVFTNSTGASGAVFHASAIVSNTGTGAAAPQLRATVRDAAGSPVGSPATGAAGAVDSGTTATQAVSVSVPSGIKYWGVQSPTLYTVTIELLVGGAVVDSQDIAVGVRTVRFDADRGLFLNEQRVKMRGFCDHSSFAGVGAAVPDRINLFRAQALRAVGGNSWRMAHNPPAVARLDYMDALGMLALDENRDYGGNRGQGGTTAETVSDELLDMRDLIKRDRSHASVIWWSFCNEVGCDNQTAAKAFREVSKLWDPTRAVTQNHHGDATSTDYLDVQGFSHKQAKDFIEFRAQYPRKPMAATECCSCMSQRGVDEDVCPKPADGGCKDTPGPVPSGTFYNNNIGQCTYEQVNRSDSLDFVAGTFVWSGFDYLGEARGWPQNTKCRGTVSDVAGFTKETAYWCAWRPRSAAPPLTLPALQAAVVVAVGDPEGRSRPAAGHPRRRSAVDCLHRGILGAPAQGLYSLHQRVHQRTPGEARAQRPHCRHGGRARVHNGVLHGDVRPWEPHCGRNGPPRQRCGVAHCQYHRRRHQTGAVARHAVGSHRHGRQGGRRRRGCCHGSRHCGGCAGAHGARSQAQHYFQRCFRPWADLVRFLPRFPWHAPPFKRARRTTHNGDPANTSPNTAAWNLAYHGLARAIVRTTEVHAGPEWHRRRLLEIDADSGSSIRVIDPAAAAAGGPADIVVHATAEGFAPATVTIPVSSSVDDLPIAVARRAGSRV